MYDYVQMYSMEIFLYHGLFLAALHQPTFRSHPSYQTFRNLWIALSELRHNQNVLLSHRALINAKAKQHKSFALLALILRSPSNTITMTPLRAPLYTYVQQDNPERLKKRQRRLFDLA